MGNLVYWSKPQSVVVKKVSKAVDLLGDLRSCPSPVATSSGQWLKEWNCSEGLVSLRGWRAKTKMALGNLLDDVLTACPTMRRPRGRPTTCWREYISPGLGTPLCPPGIPGVGSQGEGGLHVSAWTDSSVTWIHGRKEDDVEDLEINLCKC